MARKAPFRERTARRLRILTGRARRTAGTRKPKHRSVFLHMPKCGGTSISEAMYATVPFSQRLGVIDAVSTRRAAAMLKHGQDDPALCHEDLAHGQDVFDLREGMLLQHMAWDSWLLHGHVLYSDKAESHFGDRYKYVTLLRDPVERMISNFRMTQRAGVVTEDLDNYLDGPVARSHAQVFLRYLYGKTVIADEEVPEALELAKARLAKFAVIGFLDDLEGFTARYRDVFGVSLRVARLNAAPDRKPDYSEAQMERIRALCAPDLEIYRFAQTLG